MPDFIVPEDEVTWLKPNSPGSLNLWFCLAGESPNSHLFFGISINNPTPDHRFRWWEVGTSGRYPVEAESLTEYFYIHPWPWRWRIGLLPGFLGSFPLGYGMQCKIYVYLKQIRRGNTRTRLGHQYFNPIQDFYIGGFVHFISPAINQAVPWEHANRVHKPLHSRSSRVRSHCRRARKTKKRVSICLCPPSPCSWRDNQKTIRTAWSSNREVTGIILYAGVLGIRTRFQMQPMLHRGSHLLNTRKEDV